MKLDQIFDTKIDQNEIDTKYLWNFNTGEIKKPSTLIDLSTFTIYPIPENKTIANHIIQTMPIPSNKFFGQLVYDRIDTFRKLFISDENLNTKIIDSFYTFDNVPYWLISCFYNNSIFSFESGVCITGLKTINNRGRKYSMISEKWDILASLPFKNPRSCIGINQKIIIATLYPEIWVYDIALDSFSDNFLNKAYNKKFDQMLIKYDRKIYLLVLSENKEIFCCNDPLEKWSFLGRFRENMNYFRSIVYYRGLFYYPDEWEEKTIYEFSLAKFEPKPIKVKAKENKKTKRSLINAKFERKPVKIRAQQNINPDISLINVFVM